MAGPVSEGSPEPLGLTLDRTGANVAVYSAHAEAIELCLFDADGETEIERLRLPARTGPVFHGHFEGIAAGQRYAFRAYGPYAPKEGHRFNPAKLLADPHALMLDRPFAFSPVLLDYRLDAPAGDFLPEGTDSAPFMPKAIAAAPAPAPKRRRARRAWADTVIYELHVRGFTMLHPLVPEALRGTFAGLAHPAAIEHLAKLGVTCVEIMPAAAWVDERHLHAAGLTNYWGYNPVTLMAPDPRLAPGGWAEIAACVGALQAAGIEVIVDVVLNHTGEGDQFGPTLSLRGLDNASYYRLMPQDPLVPVNDTGCGNTLALDRPPVVRLAMDALQGLGDVRRRGRLPFRPRHDAGPARGRLRRGRAAADGHCARPGFARAAADRRALGFGAGRLPHRRIPFRLGRVERQVPGQHAQVLARRRGAPGRGRDALLRIVRSFRLKPPAFARRQLHRRA